MISVYPAPKVRPKTTANIRPLGSEYVTDVTGGLRTAPSPNTPKKINPIQPIWPPDSDSPSHCVLSQAETSVDRLMFSAVAIPIGRCRSELAPAQLPSRAVAEAARIHGS